MDVLQQIFRSNGRSQNLLQHAHTGVGEDRGRYYIRGVNEAPYESVTVYLTGEEIDRLTALRQRQLVDEPTGIFAALGVLRRFGGHRDPAAVPKR